MIKQLKINLKSIFQKTQANNMKKKKKKVLKKIPKKKKIVLKTNKKKVKEAAPLTKKNYSNEDKVEIKKIKKQSTEKRQYDLKDFVVYPKHGVGKIIAVEKANIGQIDIQFYKIFIEKEKLTLSPL